VGEQLLRAQPKKEHRSVVEPSRAHQSGVKDAGLKSLACGRGVVYDCTTEVQP
jgi:hypothetical protein